MCSEPWFNVIYIESQVFELEKHIESFTHVKFDLPIHWAFDDYSFNFIV